MLKKLKQFAISLTVALGLLTPVMPVLVSVPVAAASSAETMFGDKIQTNLFGEVDTDDKGSGIKRLLSLVVTVLLYGIGAAAVIGVVVAGIMDLTARDHEAQMTKAKTRWVEGAIGLIAWAMLFVLLQWLIPGFTEDTLNGNP